MWCLPATIQHCDIEFTDSGKNSILEPRRYRTGVRSLPNPIKIPHLLINRRSNHDPNTVYLPNFLLEGPNIHDTLTRLMGSNRLLIW